MQNIVVAMEIPSSNVTLPEGIPFNRPSMIFRVFMPIFFLFLIILIVNIIKTLKRINYQKRQTPVNEIMKADAKNEKIKLAGFIIVTTIILALMIYLIATEIVLWGEE